MTLWEKIRDGILDISSKTGDFIKSGAEKTAETATYTSKLTQLTWERRGIQNKIEDEYVELGTLLHKLQKENRIDDLKKEAKSSFENLASYEKNLAEIDSEKELPETGLHGPHPGKRNLVRIERLKPEHLVILDQFGIAFQ